MVEYTNTFKVAAVQAQPVWFDAAKTVDKTVSIIAEAARNGCELVAFPEVFIPGYPYHIWVDSPLAGMAKFAVRYHENSLTMDSPHVQRLFDAARDHNIAVVVGISERDGGSLYMTQLVIDADGQLVARRRKLKPTHVERSVYGEGNGSDISVYDMPFARLGALNCWEHFQTLTKYAMYSMHEQVHVAGWPGMSLYQPEVPAFGVDAQLTATRMYALEGQTFVVCTTQVVTPEAHEFFCDNDEQRKLIGRGGGFARIIGPDGRDLATPLAEDEEGILYADIDLSAITLAKQAADPVGHYSRPDVLSLNFNQRRTTPVNTAISTIHATHTLVPQSGALDGVRELNGADEQRALPSTHSDETDRATASI
ncbi:carbon-nitrogen hydrolase family protein [Gordonia sputi]|uniref:Putative hydrolase n=1 Tax=Gordonia sputi NBRC 100414 TaxID=1089453 RepID=H5TVP0_9ACTN|nr:carbon-nitrogen hydrolase family protein [Gordonia sputi]NKY96027.1 carbon-nitrogen hydrolase family protein [Gordonia sputi]GAB37548.1 putative hydrolase [Gordonia sputi NBRC 100414]